MKASLRAVLAMAMACVAWGKESDLLNDLSGTVKAAQTAVEASKAHTFTLYVQNLNRSIIDINGAVSSQGDQVYANGLVYASPDNTTAALGVMDLTAFTTTPLLPTSERRQLFIELEFADGALARVAKDVAIREAGVAKAGLGDGYTDSLSFAGVESYPAGGGLRTKGFLNLAITGGTGAYMGARGQVAIQYTPRTRFFAYKITLV